LVTTPAALTAGAEVGGGVGVETGVAVGAGKGVATEVNPSPRLQASDKRTNNIAKLRLTRYEVALGSLKNLDLVFISFHSKYLNRFQIDDLRLRFAWFNPDLIVNQKSQIVNRIDNFLSMCQGVSA
jgi:hypothetical protein